MSGFFGTIGAIIGAIGTAIAGSVAAVIVFILWRSGTLGAAWEVLTAFVTGAWGALGQFWGFMTELVGAF